MNVLRLFRFKRSIVVLLWVVISARGLIQAAPLINEKDRAVSALEEDVKADPHNAELWLHLGFAYRKLDKIDQAEAAFEKATALDPKAKDAYFMLGLIYENKHRNSDAVQAWESYMAMETNPEKRGIAQKHIHHLSQ